MYVSYICVNIFTYKYQLLLLTLFGAYTGCRFSEAARLTWERIDFKENVVLFQETKNGDSRKVDLAPELITMLKGRIPGKPGEHIFTTNKGLTYKEPPRAFRNAVDHLELNKDRSPRDKVSYHTLRHTAATLASKNGASVKDLQVMFGWKTPSMVFNYVKGDRDEQKRAMSGIARSLKGDNEKIIAITATA